MAIKRTAADKPRFGYDLRRAAKGSNCLIRIPGVCNYNPETVVLCHSNLPGVSGMGMKAPDICAARGCSNCHDAVDGRRKTDFTKQELATYFYEGVIRTLAEVDKEVDFVKR